MLVSLVIGLLVELELFGYKFVVENSILGVPISLISLLILTILMIYGLFKLCQLKFVDFNKKDGRIIALFSPFILFVLDLIFYLKSYDLSMVARNLFNGGIVMAIVLIVTNYVLKED